MNDPPELSGVFEAADVPGAPASTASAPRPAITQSAIPKTSFESLFQFPCIARMASFLVITGSRMGFILTALPLPQRTLHLHKICFSMPAMHFLDLNNIANGEWRQGYPSMALQALPVAEIRSPRRMQRRKRPQEVSVTGQEV